MTKNANELGKLAYRSGPERCEKIKNANVTKIEADVQRTKESDQIKIRTLVVEEKEIGEKLRQMNISKEVLRQNLMRACWACSLLLSAAVGEFFFNSWIVEPFGLGRIESTSIAIAIVVMSFEGVDRLMGPLRKIYPHLNDHIQLVLGCMGFLSIALMVFFSAEIRQALQQMSFMTAETALEDQVRNSDAFHNNEGFNYILLMSTLTFAVTIIGGISYHNAKSRLLFYAPLRKLYHRRETLRQEMKTTAEHMAAQDARVPAFIAEFEEGVAIEEQIESARKSKPTKSQGAVKPNRVGKFLPPLIPLILVLLAVLIFLILRGEAKADQLNIIFLDLSGSQRVTGYSGKKTEFQKNVRSIEDFIRNNLVPGDELKVVGITESTFSRPNVLLDGTVSREKGAFGENLAREKLRLLNKWKSLDLKPTAKKTDILGAANLAAILFSDRPGKKHLIFFSDMRQCTRELDIETPNQIDCKKALATVTQKGLVPDMQGIQVICLGVHSAKKTPVYWRNLKQFWAAFFHQANAKLVTFTMERRFVHE